MLTAAQRKLRLTGVCSSDIASIIGVNPYRCALEVYRIKIGEEKEPNLDGRMCVQLGLLLEPFIASRYVAATGTPLDPGGGTWKHRDDKWMMATPDRIGLGPDGVSSSHIVELKTVGCRQARRWTDEKALPQEYQAQVRWQMAVCEIDRCDVAALIGNEEHGEHGIMIHTIHRDESIERTMIETAREFWFDHVLKRVEPRAGATEADGRAILGMHPRARKTIIDAGPREEYLALCLEGVLGQGARIERERLKITNELKQLMGDAEGIATSRGTITWRGKKSRRFLPPRGWHKASRAPEKSDQLDGQGELLDLFTHDPDTYEKWRAATDAGHEDKAERILAQWAQDQMRGGGDE